MSKTIVFIHGAWMTPLCWDKFIPFFEEQGFTCHAPAWPYKDKSVEDLRENPPAELANLGITEIVDHYEKIIQDLTEPPILIGHSFGGLFVQMLLDRGLGIAGISIDPAPPKGVIARYYSAFKSNFLVLKSFRGWKKIHRISFKQFRYAFIHLLPEEEQKEIYETYVVPNGGRIFYQVAFSLFNSASKVNFKNHERAPLLLIAGEKDKAVPAKLNKTNYKKYKKSKAITNFKEFENRCHWIIGQDGWEEVANYILEWLNNIKK